MRAKTEDCRPTLIEKKKKTSIVEESDNSRTTKSNHNNKNSKNNKSVKSLLHVKYYPKLFNICS